MTQQQQMIWLDLSEAEKFGSNSYSTTIFQHKYINSGQYGGISCKFSNNPSMQRQAKNNAQYDSDNDIFQYCKNKDDDPPEESRLTSFEGFKYIQHYK